MNKDRNLNTLNSKNMLAIVLSFFFEKVIVVAHKFEDFDFNKFSTYKTSIFKMIIST
jgi:hypothetical protein